MSQEPRETQPREESTGGTWGKAGERRVAPPAARENSGARPSPPMPLRPHHEARGQTEASREVRVRSGMRLHSADTSEPSEGQSSRVAGQAGPQEG